MQENISLFTRISAKSFLKWLLIFFPGMLFSVICVIWGFILLFKGMGGSPGPAHAGGAGAVIFFGVLCLANPSVALMIFFSLFVFPFVYYSLATKKATIYAVKSLWDNKLQNWLNTRILNYLEKLETSENSKLLKINNFATLKIKLLHAIKEDPEINKFQRKVLCFVVNRIDDSAVLADPNDEAKFSDMLLLKINDTMNALTTPKNSFFFVTLGIQVVFLILAITLNRANLMG